MSKLKALYHDLNRISKGRLNILRTAFVTFARTRAAQAAASLAYYTFFSIFPLLLVIIAAGSFLLNKETFYQDVSRVLQMAIPVSSDLIVKNLNQVIQARSTVGILSLVTLFWSASGMFTNLATNIAFAWPKAYRRNFLQIQLSGIVMVVGLSALLILSLAAVGATGFVHLAKPGVLSSLPPGVWRLLSSLGSALVLFPFFLVLYRWVPARGVKWRAAVWGALVTSVGWQAALQGFTWYLVSGLGRYQVVYGSLWTIMALLFLIYLLSVIILFAAHLSAAIDQWQKQAHIDSNSKVEAEERR